MSTRLSNRPRIRSIAFGLHALLWGASVTLGAGHLGAKPLLESSRVAGASIGVGYSVGGPAAPATNTSVAASPTVATPTTAANSAGSTSRLGVAGNAPGKSPAQTRPAAAPTGAGTATDGVAAVPAVTPTEKRAAALASEAMNKDFLNMNFVAAEKKLRRAVEMCLSKNSCSIGFLARLHRDIGVLYITGMNRVEDGKDEFMAALTADGTVAIARETSTDTVEAAFLEVKRSISADGASASAPKPIPTEAKSRVDTAFVEPSASEDEDAWRDVANWVSLGVQQDFMLHTATKNICNIGSRYHCYDGANQYQDYSFRGVSRGNEVSSTGLKIATTRVLVGYERLLSKNFSVGIKLGMLIAGKTPRLATDPKVVLFHGEGRLTYYPGVAPFAPTKRARPYLFLSGGIAEIDSKIAVEVYESNGAYSRVLAWKRGGKGFVGAGLGLAFAFGKKHGPYVELRGMRMLEKPAITGALQAGYAVGF